MIPKILIVEDIDSMRRVIVQRLSKLGADLVLAPDFASAVIEMNKHPKPDIIILDPGLPDALPIQQMIEVLHQFNPNAPISILTGQVDDKIEQAAAAAGADAFREKIDMQRQEDFYRMLQEAGRTRAKREGISFPDAMLKLQRHLDSLLIEA